MIPQTYAQPGYAVQPAYTVQQNYAAQPTYLTQQNYLTQPQTQMQVQALTPQQQALATQQLLQIANRPLGIQEAVTDPFEQILGTGNPFAVMQKMMQEMENMQANGALSNQNNNSGIQAMLSMGGLGNGTMISKTYCSKTDYSSGQPKQESYQSQAIKQFGKDGHNISETQEAYKNSTGVQKAAFQKLLDDKGLKQIKERNINTGYQNQRSLYKGINENDVNNFNQYYNDYRQKVHFQDNYKYLNEISRGGLQQLGSNVNNQQVPMLPYATGQQVYNNAQVLPQNYNYGYTQGVPGNNYAQVNKLG